VNGTLHTIDGHTVLRFERRLRHPVEKVWRAITDPAQLAHWFPANMEMDLQEGATIRFVFPGGELSATDGVITELAPPRVFAYTWNGEPLRWELRPEGAGCLLVFTHTFGDRPMAGSFATGWETCLGSLEAVVAGRPPATPPMPEAYAERHDAYVEAFGLGEGSVRNGSEGWAIRFERLLPHPVEEVWPALAEGSGPAVGGPPPLRATNGYVPAGALTAAAPRTLLEYDWLARGEPAGRVRWELTGGHPAGTRVVLTQSGPARLAGDRVTALAAWHTQLEIFADHLRGITHCPWPEERTKELKKHYADRVEAR
jgi:uncharacterized protein YndB with AHSA1/START domain